MLEVEGSEELNEVVLRPYPNKNYSVVLVGETKLCLGIECENRTNAGGLVLFVRTEEGIHELEWLYFRVWVKKAPMLCMGDEFTHHQSYETSSPTSSV